jgi:hypothetical protein
MPVPVVENHVSGMIQHSRSTIYSFGKDSTGKIEYRFNQQGFRGKNFDFVPEYAFFGCSMVFGIGVPENQTFVYSFPSSQNYGLAGRYDNHDVMLVLQRFISSDLYTSKSNLAVVWHIRDSKCLESFYNQLCSYHNLVHFFCGDPLPYQRCFPVPREMDQDVSSTHPGPKSHYFFHRVLSSIFSKSPSRND